MSVLFFSASSRSEHKCNLFEIFSRGSNESFHLAPLAVTSEQPESKWFRRSPINFDVRFHIFAY